ncbi:hypothetical protein JYT48_01095 [Mariprofundus ferrooxydans]|nr:hypothetical protein [Mariprofundus ferrooxydans]
MKPELLNILKVPTFKSLDMTYADIDQQWIVVYSPQANARARHSVSKQYEKKSLADQRLFDGLRKQAFACEKDALKAVEALRNKLKISTLHDTQIEAVAGLSKRGRLASNANPTISHTEFVARWLRIIGNTSNV